jgi:hypothetical protein
MTNDTKQPEHQPGTRKFYVMEPDIRGGGPGHGMKLANADTLKYPGFVVFGKPAIHPAGFDYFTERPQIVYDKEEGHLPRDLESYGGYWLVSDRMRRVLEEVDAEGFAFAPCDYVLPDGSLGPQYHLCDVVRTLDALDEQASKLRIKFVKDHDSGEEIKIRGLSGTTKLIFRAEVVGPAHIFRQECLSADPICDAAMRDACTEIGLTGIQFRDFNP